MYNKVWVNQVFQSNYNKDTPTTRVLKETREKYKELALHLVDQISEITLREKALNDLLSSMMYAGVGIRHSKEDDAI